MTPKSEAIAFRIWQYANPREWDVTYTELAEELDVPVQSLGRLVHSKGWQGRIRAPSGHHNDNQGSNPPRYAAVHLARDIAAGRVTYDPT